MGDGKVSKLNKIAKFVEAKSFLHKNVPAFLFRDLDKSKDGILQLDERPTGMNRKPDEIKEKIRTDVASWDANKNGCIDNGWGGAWGWWWAGRNELADLQQSGYTFTGVRKPGNKKDIDNKSRFSFDRIYNVGVPENEAYWSGYGKCMDVEKTITTNIQSRPLVNMGEVPFGDYKQDDIYILTKPTERRYAQTFGNIADDDFQVRKGEKLKNYASNFIQFNQNKKLTEAGLLDEGANKKFREESGIELPRVSIVTDSEDPNFIGYDPKVLADPNYQVRRDTKRNGTIDEVGKDAWNFYDFYDGYLITKDNEKVEGDLEPNELNLTSETRYYPPKSSRISIID